VDVTAPARGVAIVGATTTGKSELAVALALDIRGQVVNADSMQLYRGMDVGTAKLTEAERRGVPHHLLDVLDVTEEASVAAYQRDAHAIVEALRGSGQVPILAGGSGLYVAAVLDDLDFPGTDPEVRARLEADLARDGAAALHARLAAVDPQAAAAIQPMNGRRLVRALEVVEVTGRPFRASLPRPRPVPPAGREATDWVRVGLTVPREVLDERIAARVDRMWEAGLVDEVRALVPAGLRRGRTASHALGYAQVLRHLDGDLSEGQARTETVRATSRFARRQESWFRRDPTIHWLDATGPDLFDRTRQLVAAAVTRA
jgi:tRNA dimethylallyltransferase